MVYFTVAGGSTCRKRKITKTRDYQYQAYVSAKTYMTTFIDQIANSYCIAILMSGYLNYLTVNKRTHANELPCS